MVKDLKSRKSAVKKPMVTAVDWGDIANTDIESRSRKLADTIDKPYASTTKKTKRKNILTIEIRILNR